MLQKGKILKSLFLLTISEKMNARLIVLTLVGLNLLVWGLLCYLSLTNTETLSIVTIPAQELAGVIKP